MYLNNRAIPENAFSFAEQISGPSVLVFCLLSQALGGVPSFARDTMAPINVNRPNLFIPSNEISSEQKRKALEGVLSLAELVDRQAPPPEPEWQKFFDAKPIRLSEAVRVRFDGLYSQIRLTSGNP